MKRDPRLERSRPAQAALSLPIVVAEAETEAAAAGAAGALADAAAAAGATGWAGRKGVKVAATWFKFERYGQSVQENLLRS